jgi:hypothetical protein
MRAVAGFALAFGIEDFFRMRDRTRQGGSASPKTMLNNYGFGA